MFADVEPPHRFVRETPASVVHHADYLNHRDDHALCGVAFENPATLAQADSADAMCPDCEAQLVVYHLEWWRGRAQAATAELQELRVKYRELQEYADTQRRQPTPTQVGKDPSGEISLPPSRPKQSRKPSLTMRDGNSPSFAANSMELSPSCG